MIQIDKVAVSGWEAAIRGARNAMNSWALSDSYWTYVEDSETHQTARSQFFLGERDFELLKKLAVAGTDHGKGIRYIDVTLDIEAPLFWWKEFKTYRNGRKFMDDEDEFTIDPELFEQDIEMNSCSTMHKIHSKPFELDDFSHEHLRSMALNNLESTIRVLNHYRTLYLQSKDKAYWWQLIELLPSSYNQRRTVKLNYAVLRNMYHARKHHKLDDWRIFCFWIEGLPYSELITETGK